MFNFSIVICTLNRENVLDNCIESLMRQTYKNFEIIIIDQSDCTNKKYSDQQQTIIYRHISEKGLSNARNIALKIASGDYICLMDDDAEYADNFLEKANEVLQIKHVGILCGKIIDKDTGRVGLKGMRKDEFMNVQCKNIFEYCMSPSMVIKSNVLKQNPFDVRFGVGRRWGAGEETDIALRFLYLEEKILYNPFMIVFHPALRRDEIKIEKVYSYNLGFGALYKKHIVSCQNKKMLPSFIWWIARNLIGILLFGILFNKKAVSYYYNSAKGKLVGYWEY